MNASPPSTLLLTGAAGRIGTGIRPHLARAGHRVILLDTKSIAGDVLPNERVVRASFDDAEAMDAIFRTGVDAVVHFAGIPTEAAWDDIRRVNIDATRALVHRAAEAGVRRLVLASSIHAVGFASVAEAAATAVLDARPDGYYGLSKVMLEGIGSLYADRYGIAVTTVRIASYSPEPVNLRSLALWCSPADIARIVIAAVGREDAGQRIIWGVSANSRGVLDRSASADLVETVDDAEQWADALGAAPGPVLAPDALLGDAFASKPLGG